MTKVTFEGGKELQAMLASLPQSVSRKIKREVLVEAAEPMVAVSRKLVQRGPDAPHIKDNIEIGTARTSGDDAEGTATAKVLWGPVRGFPNARWLEFGTVHHPAFPFIRPAFDSQSDRSLEIIKRRLWEHIQSWVLSRDVR